MKTQWFNVATSYFYLKLDTSMLISEWHVVGRVQLRQVYAEFPAQWYAWVDRYDARGYPEAALLVKCDSAEEARAAVEAAVLAEG